MTKKKSKSTIKYFLLLFTITSFVIVPLGSVTAASRWYAGYRYERSSSGSSSCPDGIMADIYCVSPVIPFAHVMFQFVAVVTSYSPTYWLQIGYLKQYTWCFIFPCVLWAFYYETHSTLGQIRFGWPVSKHWYNFRIWRLNSLQFKWAVYEGYTWLGGNTIPFTSGTDVIDLWATVEVSTPSIDIWTSHFKKLKYWTGNSWQLWDRYPPTLTDDPGDYYYVQTISAHEFKAWKR